METLSITLSLLPGPDIVAPGKQAGRGAARPRSAHGGGGGRDSGGGAGAGAGAGGGGVAGAGGGNGGAAGANRPEWACSRCTCLNAERRWVGKRGG